MNGNERNPRRVKLPVDMLTTEPVTLYRVRDELVSGLKERVFFWRCTAVGLLVVLVYVLIMLS